MCGDLAYERGFYKSLVNDGFLLNANGKIEHPGGERNTYIYIYIHIHIHTDIYIYHLFTSQTRVKPKYSKHLNEES